MKPDNYSRRKNVLTAKDKTAMSKWATKPAPDAAKIDRTRLWESLNAFVMKHQARIVSPLHSFPLRLQVPLDSELPQKLKDIGYNCTFKSRDTIIGAPMADWRAHNYNTGHVFRVVQTFELDLPRPSGDTPDKRLAVQ